MSGKPVTCFLVFSTGCAFTHNWWFLMGSQLAIAPSMGRRHRWWPLRSRTCHAFGRKSCWAVEASQMSTGSRWWTWKSLFKDLATCEEAPLYRRMVRPHQTFLYWPNHCPYWSVVTCVMIKWSNHVATWLAHVLECTHPALTFTPCGFLLLLSWKSNLHRRKEAWRLVSSQGLKMSERRLWDGYGWIKSFDDLVNSDWNAMGQHTSIYIDPDTLGPYLPWELMQVWEARSWWPTRGIFCSQRSRPTDPAGNSGVFQHREIVTWNKKCWGKGGPLDSSSFELNEEFPCALLAHARFQFSNTWRSEVISSRCGSGETGPLGGTLGIWGRHAVKVWGWTFKCLPAGKGSRMWAWVAIGWNIESHQRLI